LPFILPAFALAGVKETHTKAKESKTKGKKETGSL
jgi:hypothetical protein